MAVKIENLDNNQKFGGKIERYRQSPRKKILHIQAWLCGIMSSVRSTESLQELRKTRLEREHMTSKITPWGGGITVSY
jgi:hypothetical protein